MQPKLTVKPDGAFTVLGGGQVAAKLVVVAGPDQGLEVALNGTIAVGSLDECEMQLRDAAVSRRHATFSVSDGRIRVKDLGSSNGTFLGDTRVVEADISIGAVLTLGNTSLAIHPSWWIREVTPSTARQFGELLGESVAMREIFAILERVAYADVGVLIEGESGTGKELVARSIHSASVRAGKPYVVFDCTSIPRNLAESELFGHRQGAFSGATSDRSGAFERADGGTICLDEIGELPIDLQSKLLRVLETGEIRAVGADEPRTIDVRVVAATNRDLHAEAARGNFRSDLLYRIEVVKLRMPPLRQRPQDIPMLVSHFLRDKLPAGDAVTGDNLQRLMGYSWPGNVRELRNTLARAVALANRPNAPLASFAQLVFNLGPASAAPVTIGMDFPGVSSPLPYKDAKAQLTASFDRAYVEALMERHKGNVTQAAKAAGLSRKHLYSLIEKATGQPPG